MKSDRIIEINEEKIKDHLGEFVKGTVEETLNAMLDAEADAICNAQKYEHTPERKDTRAGSYGRKLQTRGGEKLQMPRRPPFVVMEEAAEYGFFDNGTSALRRITCWHSLVYALMRPF